MFLTLEVIEVNAEIFQQEKKMIFYNFQDKVNSYVNRLLYFLYLNAFDTFEI